MYHAIVFLPLLGAIIATLITLAGARARFPGGSPDAVADGHGHAPVDESHARAAQRNDRRDDAAEQREENDRLIHKKVQPFIRLMSSTAIEPRLR